MININFGRWSSFKYSGKIIGWRFGRCNSTIIFISIGCNATKNAIGYDGTGNGQIRVNSPIKSNRTPVSTINFDLISFFSRCFHRVGMVSTLKHIYSENGIVRGLYRGMSINYLRAIPMVAVSFSTYEVLKQALNLDTGMKI